MVFNAFSDSCKTCKIKQYFVPVRVRYLDNDRHEQRESYSLVAFQNGEEVVVFKKAHCAISDLQVRARYAPDKSLEQFVDLRF